MPSKTRCHPAQCNGLQCCAAMTKGQWRLIDSKGKVKSDLKLSLHQSGCQRLAIFVDLPFPHFWLFTFSLFLSPERTSFNDKIALNSILTGIQVSKLLWAADFSKKISHRSKHIFYIASFRAVINDIIPRWRFQWWLIIHRFLATSHQCITSSQSLVDAIATK